MCSHCGCRALSPVARLTAEHEQVLELLGEVRRAVDAQALDDCVTRLEQVLIAHTRGEERSLFSELRDDPVLGDHVAALCAEHGEIDAALSGLRTGDPRTFSHFETLLRRHIDKEENGLFPAAAIALDGAGWDRVDRLLRLDLVTLEVLARWQDSGGSWRLTQSPDPEARTEVVELVSCTGEVMDTIIAGRPT